MERLEAAAEAIAMAGYFNAGQDCTAATRVLAGPGIHDDFVAALADQTGRPGAQVWQLLYGPAPATDDELAAFARALPELEHHARKGKS